MQAVIDQLIMQVHQLFAGRPAWLIILTALVITVILRFVLGKLFKLAANVLIFALIYIAVLLGLGYLLNGVMAQAALIF